MFIFSVCILASSCSRVQDVPFPDHLAGYLQPETLPLELTEPVALRWDTVQRGALTPTVFPLDFSKMKGMPYDAKGFKPLPVAPTETTFDFASLPSKTFDITKVPEQELKMTLQPLPETFTSVMAPLPKRVTTSSLDLQTWKASVAAASPSYFVKDPSGFLWIGTNYGLYRFNGTHLENILPKSYIGGMNIDHEGRIWFTGRISLTVSTINMVDLKKGIIGSLELPYIFYNNVPVNSHSDSSIWLMGVKSEGSVIIRINPQKLTYQILDNEAALGSNFQIEVVEDDEKNKWFSSYSGIDILLYGTNKIVHLSKQNGLSSDTVRAITKGSDGRMWVSWPKGVDAINLKQGKIPHYQTNFSSGDRVTKLKFDREGQLWQGGMDNGITILNLKNNTFRNINEGDGLEPIMITDIFDDGRGRMFLSSSKADFSGSSIHIVGQYGKTVYPFGNQPVYTTAEDGKGHLWIGTGEQLYAVDSVRKTYWRIDSSHGLANNFIQSVTSREGNVVVTTMGGYNIFNAGKNEFLRYGKQEGLLAGNVYSVMQDAGGNQWIGADSNGIYKYDPVNKLTLQLNHAGGLNGHIALQTTKMKNGNIWSMTDSVPAIINPSADSIQMIKNYPVLSDRTEKIIFVDSHDRIWLGLSSQYSKGGLYMVDNKNKTISKFSVQNGLSNNIIVSILEYEGKIIIGAYEKINIITPPELSVSKKWEIGILKGSENLVKLENSYLSDAITKDGNYIWGDAGIRIIYGIETDTSVAQCFVSGMSIMAQPINFPGRKDTGLQKTEMKNLRWDSLAGPYFMPQNLRMPYNKNIVQFQFSEMSTGRTDSITYAYILEGLDKKWVTTKDDHTQTYLNLTPGDYIFKVRSKWAGGRWSEAAIMPFTIKPPWYNTWWAYLAYLIVAASLLRAYIVFRSRKLMHQNKLLEEKVNLRTEELRKSYNNVEQLGQIGRKITSSLSIERIIGTAYKNVNALMDAAVFGIGIYDPEKETLEFPATFEGGKQLPPYSNALSETNRFSVVCFNTGEEIVMDDVENQYKKYIDEYLPPSEGEHTNSLVYLPLIINDKKLGVITVQSFEKNAYSANNLNILRNIATYAAIALENAGSYSKLNQSLENLKAAQAQLVHSEKMASLGELTAGIAHEIQNPLNFVNNFADINVDLIGEMLGYIDNGDMKDVKELAETIKSNEGKIIFHGKRADGIVKSMLQHSRSSGDTRVITDINNLCDEYLRLAFHGMRARDKSFNSSMETEFDETAGKLNVVPQDIGRVLLNLLTNAFYEVNEKRKLGIEDYQPMVKLKTLRSGHTLEIDVVDNGRGIPDELKEKIFQPFFTTKPTGKGTGLGLSLSYDIIKAHGGEVQVEGKKGEGTVFRISLPL